MEQKKDPPQDPPQDPRKREFMAGSLKATEEEDPNQFQRNMSWVDGLKKIKDN